MKWAGGQTTFKQNISDTAHKISSFIIIIIWPIILYKNILFTWYEICMKWHSNLS